MTLSIQEIAERFQFPPAPQAAPNALAPETAGGASTPGASNPAAVPAAPATAVQIIDYASRGYHLDVRVTPDRLVAAATLLDQLGFGLDTITGVDWMADGQMEVVYDFFHPEAIWRVVVRTRIPRDCPEVPTLTPVFAGANWHERETHDFFGIKFEGHPNLTPFLLPEDADYHPLRKDFSS